MKRANEYISTLFPEWEDVERRLLSEKLERVEVKKGETLFKRGDSAEMFYFVVEGRFGVKKNTGFEDKKQIIALLDEGAPIGERSIISESSGAVDCIKKRGCTLPAHGADVVAVQDSLLYCLSKKKYRRFVKENPVCALQFVEWLLARISIRLEKASERLAHIL